MNMPDVGDHIQEDIVIALTHTDDEAGYMLYLRPHRPHYGVARVYEEFGIWHRAEQTKHDSLSEAVHEYNDRGGKRRRAAE